MHAYKQTTVYEPCWRRAQMLVQRQIQTLTQTTEVRMILKTEAKMTQMLNITTTKNFHTMHVGIKERRLCNLVHPSLLLQSV
jgi:hypothetical protein